VPPADVRAVAFLEVGLDPTTPDAFAADAVAHAPPFDYVWLTPAAEREDPCAAFRRHMPGGAGQGP
jgi:hypothetical protein